MTNTTKQKPGVVSPSLRKALAIPFLISLFVILCAFSLSLLWVMAHEEAEHMHSGRTRLERYWPVLQGKETEILEAWLEKIKGMESVRDAFLSRNRAALLRETMAINQRLLAHNHITHFYFTGPDRVNFLRVHQPDRYGDRIDRITTQQAEQTGEIAHGIELGPLGTLTLRVVLPWYDKERLIGFIELGIEVSHWINELQQITDLNLYTLIDKNLLQKETWQIGMAFLNRSANWDEFPAEIYVGEAAHQPLGEEGRSFLHQQRKKMDHHVAFSSHSHLFESPLHDISGRKVGRLVAYSPDANNLHDANKFNFIITMMTCLIVSGLLYWIILRILGRLEDQLSITTANLCFSETRLRTILESVQEAIIGIDHQGRIVDFNAAAENLFGYSRKAVINIDLAETIIPPNLRQPYREAFARSLKNGHLEKKGWIEVSGLCADGNIIDLEVGLTTIYLDQNPIFIGVLHDITDRKRAMESLRDTLATAESAFLARSQFFANMSHEIRTPITAIIGLTDLALLSDKSPSQRNTLVKIRDASNSLLIIINDILDLSKIDAGWLELESLAFNLDDIFDNLINLTGKQIADKGVELLVSYHTDPGLTLVGDQFRLEQVLMNLLSNARKFTDKGEIEVQVQEIEKTADRICLKFSVRDSGIGLVAEEIPKLFEAFAQADESTTRQYGGTGLGLNICKNIVEKMGGKIQVESELSQGCMFHFNIWFEWLEDKERPVPALPENLQGIKTLVIDDNAKSREIAREILNGFMLETTVADSGAEGIAKVLTATLEGLPYGVVIVDQEMPRLDGITTIQAMVRYILPISPPAMPRIILLTSFESTDFTQLVQEIGVYVVINKPVTRIVLANAIKMAFTETSTGNDTWHKSFTGHVFSPALPAVEKIAGARVLVVEDNDINREVIRGILERVGITIEIAKNGEEAIDWVARSKFDAVLMDLQMPKMDGYTATRHIRDNPRNQQLPIIAMTAHVQPEEREKCLEVGMNGHVGKPIDIRQLYSTLAQWIQLQPHPVTNDANKDHAKPLPEIAGIDIKSGLMRMGGNQKTYFDLLGQFCRNNADVAAKIKCALANGDMALAKQSVHLIKGLSGNISATRLHNSARTLETAIRSGNEQDIAMADFTSALHEVIESFKQLETITSFTDEPSKSVGYADPVELFRLLTGLSERLEEHDPDIDRWMNGLKKQLHATQAAKAFKELEDYTEKYSYEDALASIQKIAGFFNLKLKK